MVNTRLRFMVNVLNMIDLMAIAPFYVELVVNAVFFARALPLSYYFLFLPQASSPVITQQLTRNHNANYTMPRTGSESAGKVRRSDARMAANFSAGACGSYAEAEQVL